MKSVFSIVLKLLFTIVDTKKYVTLPKKVSVYLFLNDVAGSEVMLILLFILIFFGSKSIPGIARTVGRTIRQVKDATDDIQNEIKKTTGEYKKDLNLDGIFKEASEELTRPLDQAVNDLDNSVQYTPPKRYTSQPTVQEIASDIPASSENQAIDEQKIDESTNETDVAEKSE